MKLPEPDFYVHDQQLDGGYVVRSENPMPDRPSLAQQACGLYTYSQVCALLRAAEKRVL